MRIAVVSSDISYPPREGLHLHTIRLLENLRSGGHDADLYGYYRDSALVDSARMEAETGIRFARDPILYQGRMMQKAMGQRVLPSAASQELAARLLAERYDVVHLDGALAAALSARLEDSPRVLSFVDPPSRRHARAAVVSRRSEKVASLVRASATGAYERSLRNKRVLWHVVSPSDASYYRRVHPGQPVEAVPIFIPFEPLDERRTDAPIDRIHLGVFADARQEYLLRDVRRALEAISRSELRGKVDVTVLGRSPKPDAILHELRALGGTYIEWVEDLEAFASSLDIALLPDTYGTGIKTRALWAMGQGVPLVATKVALEGIPVVAGRDALVYSGSAQLLQCLRLATGSVELRERLSTSSLAFCRQTYSTKKIIAGWESAYLKAAALMGECS